MAKLKTKSVHGVQSHLKIFENLVFSVYFLFYHKIQVILKKQGDHTKANKSGEDAQKETMGLIDIGLPQSKK